MNSLIVFDLDGTLVDSRKDVGKAILHGLKSVSDRLVSFEEAAATIGRPLDDIYLELIGDGDIERARAASEAYRDYYFDHCVEETRAYEGVAETLGAIDGTCIKAVATNKRSYMAQRVLDMLGLAGHFQLIMGADHRPPKPAPDMLLELLEKYDTDPAASMMVGDTWMDIEAGRLAGMQTCAATYGVGDNDALRKSHPDRMIGTFNQLLEFWPPESSGTK